MVGLIALYALQTEAFQASIQVDFSKTLGPVPAYILGQNTEAGDSFGIFGKDHNYEPAKTGSGLWDPALAKPKPAMLAAAKEIGMSMLRFPGGCLAHNYNWKLAVGSIKERPNFAFGIDEFIQYCRLIGAEPLMTVSDYVGGPAEAAELVEYLNAPADVSHPWAQKRAAYGHVKAYNVRYFEMGNESDHGNHDVIPRNQFTPAQYAEWFNECATRMRKIDPSIKLGALTSTTFPVIENEWNDVVLKGVGKTADFIISHTYAVQIWSADKPVETPSDLLMRACMASGDQFEFYLMNLRRKIDSLTGKKLPLAITEYNAMFVQEKPLPFRFSFGGALFSVDWLRVLMKPELNVLMANYWQFSNGYWGLARDDLGSFRRMPAYWLYRMWAKHFGTQLVSSEVKAPRLSFEGGVGTVQPARGDEAKAARITSGNLMTGTKYEEASSEGMAVRVGTDGSLVSRLADVSTEKHLPLAKITGKLGARYRVSFEARTSEGLSKGTFGLSVVDGRGWEPYHSGMAIEGAENAREWKTFTGEFQSLPSAPGIVLAWRVIPHAATLSGTFEIRNMNVWTCESASFAGYSAVTASASLSADGRKGYLVLFNKHHERPCKLTIAFTGVGFKKATKWSVTGPSLVETNVEAEKVKESESAVPLTISSKKLSLSLPPGSMTAVELTR